MKPVFKDDAAKQKMLEWYERFHARLPVPTVRRMVPTRFGDTHVLVGGPSAAPPLVVVHGAMASSAHLLVELAPLLSRYRIYAIDVIGQSIKTPHPRPSVANNDYGVWLAEVLDGLALPQVALVAVSWGGFAAVRLAVHAPERITRLALLVPAGIVNGHAWQGMKKMMVPLLLWRMFPSPARFEKLARNLLSTHDDDWLPYLHDAFSSFNMDTRIPKRATAAELVSFKAPTLVIGGDEDISFPGPSLRHAPRRCCRTSWRRRSSRAANTARPRRTTSAAGSGTSWSPSWARAARAPALPDCRRDAERPEWRSRPQSPRRGARSGA